MNDWNAERLAMRPTVKVGDKVRLNNHGLEVCFGSAFGLSYMKRNTYTLTEVDQESMTYPEPTFVVEVDDPELNQLLLSDRCFDVVPAEPS